MWTREELETAISLKKQGYSYREIGKILDRSWNSVRGKLRQVRQREQDLEEERGFLPPPPDEYNSNGYVIPQSKYPVYDNPLTMEGDAIVLPDIELPFHHADFFNRALELADSWGIRKAIVAGDLLHFDSLSSWQANWVESEHMPERIEQKLMNMAMRMPEEYQEDLIATITAIEEDLDEGGTGVSKELKNARKVVSIFTELFEEIDFVLGNHDDRFLKAVESPMFPSELLRLLEAGDKWRIGPYYYSHLISKGETFQIEHPRTWAKTSPIKLASKYRCHILQGHSHRWGMDLDISGHYWAINMGCIVDERRLPYAAQRHNTADAHALGCVIVREGYPYLLSDRTPWERFKKM
jgi:hypothetical protein